MSSVIDVERYQAFRAIWLDLSPQQRRVIEGRCRGLTNHEVGDELLERVMNFQEGISRKRPSRSLRFAGLASFRGVRVRTPSLQSSPTLLWDPKIERGASEETGWATKVLSTL